MISTGLATLALACRSDRPPVQPPLPARSVRLAASLTPAPNVQGDPLSGARAFTSAGCAGCHTLRGLPGATGLAGPNLTNVALRPTLANGAIETSPDAMTRWIMDPPAIKPGTPMPKLGLSEQQARDLTALLYSLPSSPSFQQ